MPQIKTNAIVLRRADCKESDRMLTLFSPTLGRVEALCRGCRRQKSPLLASSEVFASGEYVLWQGADRTTVESCSLADSFYPLREDWDRLSHGMYWLELCLGSVQPGEENARLFLLLLRSLAHLAYGKEPPRRVSAVFLMGIVSLMGFRPSVRLCRSCGRPLGADASGASFSVRAGGVLCGNCREPDAVPLDAGELACLQGVMKRGLDWLEEEGECSARLFLVLKGLAEERLDVRPKAGALL